MSHMPALDNPERIDVTALEARVDDLEAGGGGSSLTPTGSYDVSGVRTIFPHRVHVSVDLNVPEVGGDDPAVTVITSGTNVIAHDGGVQSFQVQQYDTNTNPTCIAEAFLGAATATKTGSGTLINTTFAASASGGTVNYAWQGVSGIFRHNESMIMGTPMVVGGTSLPVGNKAQFDCDVTIGSGQVVSLGNNVQTFKVAQTGALSQVGAGISGGYAYNFLATNDSGNGTGLLVHANTGVSANQYGGIALYRGNAVSNQNFRAGIHVGNGGGQFATGDTANALLLWSYDPGGATYGIELATGSNPDVRVRIQPGGQTDVLAGLSVTGNLGVFGTTPTTKKTVSGSRGGNAALASLLTQLAAYGLITDGSSA